MNHFYVLFALVLGAFAAPLVAERPAKPNVVLILTDDLGWQDVGCYDIDEPCIHETPNIDRLASEGIQFWQGYSPAPTCAPTRVAILSGQHPARNQKTHVVGGNPPTPYSAKSPLISPWYSGRMELSEITLAEALAVNGYATGCVGKWHCAINHHASPTSEESGFTYNRMNLGETRRMENRLKDFATNAEDDPYQLDENGMPRHENSEDALEFIDTHASDPFFLYYATWLVHTPIHTRNEALLKKYCDKLGIPVPTDPSTWKTKGQSNPYYAAMVETLDYHVGTLLNYLAETDDPRWPGHKLAENTYVIFTSDNGGMERVPGEEITDNYPLDRGKINVKEGGVRVPFIIRGPKIPAGVESQTMVNGLDFYPTILNWTGTNKPAEQDLDGLDLAEWLTDPEQPLARDTMMWHFPHSQFHSTVRQGSYKLVRNWREYLQGKKTAALELYQLYDETDLGKRVDIEEAKNLAVSQPERAKEMEALLEELLDANAASRPFLNPNWKPGHPKSDLVPTVLDHGREGQNVWITFDTNGAEVARAQLIYTDNGGEKYEEWYRHTEGTLTKGRFETTLPEGTTHYVWNLVDENSFLVSHPQMRTETESKENYSVRALSVAN